MILQNICHFVWNPLETEISHFLPFWFYMSTVYPTKMNYSKMVPTRWIPSFSRTPPSVFYLGKPMETFLHGKTKGKHFTRENQVKTSTTFYTGKPRENIKNNWPRKSIEKMEFIPPEHFRKSHLSNQHAPGQVNVTHWYTVRVQ